MKRLILLCSLIVPLCWHAAFADQTLVLATVTDFPPFNYQKDDVLTGIDIDIVKEMAKRLNIEVKIVPTSWKAVMYHVETGRVDGGFAAFKTPEREQFSLYTAPLHDEQIYLFVKRKKVFSYTSLRDLDGKLIAKENGAFISEDFQQAMEQNRFDVHKGSNGSNLKMLELNRVDAVIGHLEVMQNHINALQLSEQIVPLGSIGNKRPAYLILSKKSRYPELKLLQQNIKAELKKMKNDGTYQSIIQYHLSSNP